MLKLCSKCNREYPATEEYFYEHSGMKDGLYSSCKSCYKKYNKKWQKENKERYYKISKEWRKNNPEKIKNNALKFYYGITLEDYNQLLKEQNYVCKICGEIDKNGNDLSVDHNHKTGKIRGLLCMKCNISLGIIEVYKKDPNRWDKYLKEE